MRRELGSGPDRQRRQPEELELEHKHEPDDEAVRRAVEILLRAEEPPAEAEQGAA